MNFKYKEIENYYKIKNIPNLRTVATPSKPEDYSLIFAVKLTQNELSKIIQKKSILLFVTPDDFDKYKIDLDNTKHAVVVCENPRLEYIRTLKYFTLIEIEDKNISESVKIHETSTLHSSVKISNYCTIGRNCTLEEGVIIGAGTHIKNNVTIKKNTRTGEGNIIGCVGVGVELDTKGKREKIKHQGTPMRMPHFGGVVIDEGCDIGALNAIACGAIEPTYLGKNVHIDNLCHISHNCHIEDNVSIIANTMISGSVKVGENTWIGSSCTLMQKIVIGKRNTIGIGAVVLKSTSDDEVWVGNPAKKLEKKLVK